MDLVDMIQAELLEQTDAKIRIETLAALMREFCFEKQIQSNELDESWIDSLVAFILKNTRII